MDAPPAPQALEGLEARLGLVFPKRPLAARSRVSMSVTVERQKEPLVSVSR